ncbi:conserved hypothetical protein [Pseudomonas sp. OF001]|nr:conserved hypothetical protein [Pseudomonas sp. OF001]
MTPDMLRAFSAIEQKPTTTARTRLLITRRVCRHLCTLLQSIRAERRALRRQAACLRGGLPFTKTAIERLEQLAAEHRADHLATGRHVLTMYGVLLLRDPAGDAGALSFDELCDLLNVNTVEREQARRDGATSFRDVAFIHALEDSASRRGEDCKGGPLFEAYRAAMMEFIRTAPAEQLPDPFAPGGPLYGCPVQVLNPDGSVTVKRPDLTVHDSNGARVVKR